MSKRRKRGAPPAPSRFKLGDRVRVKPGIRDEEHPDMPLGGWVGVVSKVQKRGTYSVCWTRETLANIHPIYKKRCAIDGTILAEYWFVDNDLELDTGGPLSIEQPTAITPRPPSEDKQGDRVRMVFGLTTDDFLPGVKEDSLETYYDHLKKRLSLPFEAKYVDDEVDFFSSSPLRPVKVVALDREIGWDGDEGILCVARNAEGESVVPLANLEIRRSHANFQLIDDYAAWFYGDLREDTDEDVEISGLLEETNWRNVALCLLEITAFAVSYGAVVGAAVTVMPWSRWTACIGGGVGGMFMAAVRTTSAHRQMIGIVPRFRRMLGGIVGLITGTLWGALLGIMVVGFIGAALGGLVGSQLRRMFGGKKGLVFRIFPGSVVFAAACGVAVEAFYFNRADAIVGLWYGSWIGLGSGLFLCLVILPLSFLLVTRPDQNGAG
jgi:hypothetical protein